MAHSFQPGKQPTPEKSTGGPRPSKGAADGKKSPGAGDKGDRSPTLEEIDAMEAPVFISTPSSNQTRIPEFESYYDYHFNTIDEIIEFLPERYKKCPVDLVHYHPNSEELPILYTRIMRRGQYAAVYLLADPEGGENHSILAALSETGKTFM